MILLADQSRKKMLGTIRNIFPLWVRRERVFVKLVVISLFFAACFLSKYPQHFDDAWNSLTDYGEIYVEQDSIGANAFKWNNCRNMENFSQSTPNRQRLHSLKRKIKEIFKSIQDVEARSNEKGPGDMTAVISGVWQDIYSTSDPLIDSYHKAFKALGYFVRLRADGKRWSPHVSPPLPSANWTDIDTHDQPFAVNLCLQGRCLEKNSPQTQTIATLKIYNVIDGLTNAIRHMNKNETCNIGEKTATLRCFEREEVGNLEKASSGKTELWAVIQEGVATFVTVPSTNSSFFHQELQKAQNLSAKVFVKPPFLVLERPVRISLFVVAVRSPRTMFFLHQEGVVRIGGFSAYGNPQNYEAELVWTFAQFQKYLQDTRGTSPQALWSSLQTAVSETFSNVRLSNENKTQEFTSYHVLEVTVYLTSQLKPVAVSVADHSILPGGAVPAKVLQSTLRLLLDKSSYDEETMDMSAEQAAYGIVRLEDLHGVSMDHDVLRSTAATFLHHLKAGRYGFQTVAVQNESASDVLPTNAEFWACWEMAGRMNLNADLEESNFIEDPAKHSRFIPNRGCQYDSMFRSLLASVKLSPAFPLEPQFHPLISSYQIHVPFDTMSVKMDIVPADCSTDVALAGDNSSAKQATYTVGIGENIISVNVVKLAPTFDILRTYVFSIFRKSREDSAVEFDVDKPSHRKCSWRQSCSLKIYPDEPCGLEEQDNIATNESFPGLPATQSAVDRWILSCAVDCKNESTCDWSQAKWTTASSLAARIWNQEIMDEAATQNCLQDKKVIFLGDSTNRGIMTELIQRANGTLWVDEKTHSVKTYELDFGAGRNASLTFGYYPQFWLPKRKRPSLTKTLHQILQSTGTVEPNKTVFVVGGLQFLRPSHLLELRKALARKGLEESKVVIKSFGSGFFLPAPGVKHVEKKKIQQLKEMNEELCRQSRELGFSVVDTFAMTTSRFNEFHTGKCSCHFHSVKLNSVDSNTGQKTYTVQGPINAQYSQMVLREICSV